MQMKIVFPAALAALLGGCLDQPFVTNLDLPLQVLSVTPSQGAVGVQRSAQVEVAFNLEVTGDSVSSADNIVLEDVTDPDAPAIIEGERVYTPASGTKPPFVTLTPGSLLPYSAKIRVRVTTGVKRKASEGIPEGTLLKEVTATFATEDPPALRLVSASPSSDGVDVVRGAAITLTFSEPVNCATLEAGLAVVEHKDEHSRIGGGSAPVAGVISCPQPPEADVPAEAIGCDEGACEVVFTPEAPFEYSSRVEVTLTGGSREDGAVESFRATDVGGQLEETLIYSFETLDPPTLAFLGVSPSDNAQDIEPAAALALHFSEPVRCDTLAAGLTVSGTPDPDVGGAAAAVPGTLSCTDPASIEDIGCDNDACVATFTPDDPLALSTTVSVSLVGGSYPGVVESFRATSRGGQLPATVGWDFIVEDPPALALITASPGNGATQVPLDTTLTLSFSEDVDCTTIESAISDGSLSVLETLDDATPGATHTLTLDSCAGAVAQISFAPAFAYSATVDVIVPDTLRSLRSTSRGGFLTGGAAITFVTIDPPPLRVVSTAPGNGASGVAIDANLIVNFSEDVDCASVDVNTIGVSETLDPERAAILGVSTITHTVTVASCAATQLVLDPAQSFELSSTVQVTLPGTLRSTRATLSGGFLEDGAGYSYAFDTNDPPQLVVIYTSPGDQNTLVPVDVPVVARFSEAVDLASAGEATFVVEQLDGQGGNPVDELSLGCGTAADGATAGTPCSFVASNQDDTVAFTPPAELLHDTYYRFTLTTGLRSQRASSAGGNLAVALVYEFKTIVSPPVEVVTFTPAAGQVDLRPTLAVTFNQDIFAPILTDPDPARVQIYLAPVANPGDAPDPSQRVDLDCPNCNNADSAYTFTPQADLVDGGLYVFVIKGNLGGVRGTVGGALMVSDYTREFLASGNALFVYSEPDDGAVDVNVSSRICAVFLEDIDVGTLDTTTFQVEAENDLGLLTPVALASFEVEGVDPLTGVPDAGFSSNKVCFVPAAQRYPCADVDELLPANTSVFVTLNPPLASTGGTVLDASVSTAFATGGLPTVDLTAFETLPQIGLTAPLAGAAEVPITATLYADLSAKVDATSLTAASLVRLDTGVAVAVDLSLEDEGYRLRVTPPANLDFVEDLPEGYALRIQGGASGLRTEGGRYLGADLDVTFVTSPKTLVAVSPPPGDNGYSTMQNPFIFSRPMHLPSLNTNSIYAEVAGARMSATVGTTVDAPKTAVYVAVPTYQAGSNVTLTVDEGALDYLGNPLPAPTSVVYTNISSAPALNSRKPDEIFALNVAPNAGVVSGGQVFTITLPVYATNLKNRFLPTTFNANTIRIEAALPACDGRGPLPVESQFIVGPATGSDQVRFWSTASLMGGCDYRVTLVQSGFANVYTASDAYADLVLTVTAESTAPTLLASTPQDATTVAADTPVEMTFDEDIAPASVNATTVLVDGGAVSGTLSVSGALVRFVPTAPLAAGPHTLDIGAVTDLAGNPFAGATINFDVESVAPVVQSVAIVNPSRIEVTFDEPIAAASLTPDTASLTGTLQVLDVAGNSIVYGCVRLAPGGLVAVLEPLSPLTSGAAYQVTVTTGVTDLGGTPLAADDVQTVTAP